MLYFIGDPHFGHANIIRLCGRPFEDVESMDREMIRLWNARVRPEDTVWILGDLFFRHKDPVAVLEQLTGKKRLILGNHDGSWTGKVDLSAFFEEVTLMAEWTDGQRRYTLCHYPLLTWNTAGKSFMVHGHIHGNTNSDYWPLLLVRDNVLNAGVEVNGYQPVTFEELLKNNQVWKRAHQVESELTRNPELRRD